MVPKFFSGSVRTCTDTYVCNYACDTAKNAGKGGWIKKEASRERDRTVSRVILSTVTSMRLINTLTSISRVEKTFSPRVALTFSLFHMKSSFLSFSLSLSFSLPSVSLSIYILYNYITLEQPRFVPRI